MRWTGSVLAVATFCTMGSILTAAQDLPATNPLQGNPDAIRYGMGLFRGRCADCHGMDARGVRGPDITQVWASGRTDDGLFKTIKNGVPGTEMPANPRINDQEAWQILAYLRTLAAPAPADPARGNAANGETLFRTHCSGCHRVNAIGGRIGPDLSRVGSARSRDAICANRQWPAFDVRTRQGFLFPSSASAYVESSSHQNASSNFCRSRSAASDNCWALTLSPSSAASSAAARRAAKMYPCTSHKATGGWASSPSATGRTAGRTTTR